MTDSAPWASRIGNNLNVGIIGQPAGTSTVAHRGDTNSAKVLLRDLNVRRRIRRMRRCVIASADVARDECSIGGARSVIVMATLTYRPEARWSAEHISDYLRLSKQWAARRGFVLRYQWVLELTKRGVPHYHVLFWLPYGERLPKPDESGHWPHGLSKIETARRPVGYLVKYASKANFTTYSLPKHARLFGVGGCSTQGRLAAHRAGLPMWLSENMQAGTRATRVPFVGWVERETGVIFKSPYVLRTIRDEWGIPTVVIEKTGDIP